MEHLPEITAHCHVALPSHDLSRARDFYSQILGCREMRASLNWVDFDFFGHQLTCHLVRNRIERPEAHLIDGDLIPSRHFGAILTADQWEEMRSRLAHYDQSFVIGPRLRFAGHEGEQWTLFTQDPTGNFIEFKYFTDRIGGWY
jgi:extradiol dioxygenase family protein